MVSLGTIFTLGIIGAVSVGVYALYRNADKIGGAVSRGVEETFVNPLGNWADNLWSSIENPFETSTSNASSLAGQTVASVNDSTIFVPADTTVNPDGTVSSDTPPLLELSPEEKQYATDIQKENVDESQRVLDSLKEGYYYFNFTGSKYDYQAKLTSEEANRYNTFAFSDKTDLLENVAYLGQSKLGESGLKLFAQSKNYL